MAFETFLTVDKQKPRKSRRLTFVISLGAHVVLLGVGVATSFAGVDELAPKNNPVLISLGLPTPPPPPAGRPPKPDRPKPNPNKVVRPRTNSIVAPTEATKADKDPEEPGGVDPNGNPNGDPNTIGAGTEPITEEVHRLPPDVAKGFLAIDPQQAQYRPRMPPGYGGRTVSALLRVCTDRDGNVVDVKVLRGFDPTVDAAFVSALRTWRYTPFKVQGRPVPFCTNVAYSVQTN